MSGLLGKFLFGYVCPILALLVLFLSSCSGLVYDSPNTPRPLPSFVDQVPDTPLRAKVVHEVSHARVLIVVGAVPGVSESPPCEPGGLSESAVTQQVAQALTGELQKMGVNAELFGASWRAARPLTALRGERVDAVLILHTIGCDPSQSGFRVCRWYGHNGDSESSELARRLGDAYGQEMHGRIAPNPLPCPSERANHVLLHPQRGVHRSTPAAVVELGALWADGDALQNPVRIAGMARGLARGVQQSLADRDLLDWQTQAPATEIPDAISIRPHTPQMEQVSFREIRTASVPPTSVAQTSPGLSMVRKLEQGVPFQLIHGATGQPLVPGGGVFGCQTLHAANATLDDTLWLIKAVGDHYRIVHYQSRIFLDAAPAATGDAASVMLCPFHAAEGQHWQFHASGDRVHIVARDGGGHLDWVAGHLVQSQPSADSSQQWILRPVYPAR